MPRLSYKGVLGYFASGGNARWTLRELSDAMGLSEVEDPALGQMLRRMNKNGLLYRKREQDRPGLRGRWVYEITKSGRARLDWFKEQAGKKTPRRKLE